MWLKTATILLLAAIIADATSKWHEVQRDACIETKKKIVIEKSNPSLETCKKLCDDEKSFTCGSIDYLPEHKGPLFGIFKSNAMCHIHENSNDAKLFNPCPNRDGWDHYGKIIEKKLATQLPKTTTTTRAPTSTTTTLVTKRTTTTRAPTSTTTRAPTSTTTTPRTQRTTTTRAPTSTTTRAQTSTTTTRAPTTTTRRPTTTRLTKQHLKTRLPTAHPKTRLPTAHPKTRLPTAHPKTRLPTYSPSSHNTSFVQSLGEGAVNCTSDLNVNILVPSSIITKENLNTDRPLHVEGNPECKITYNGGLAVFTGEMSLTECFELTEDQNNIVYEAKLIGGSTPAQNGVIIRKSQFALDIKCKYDRLAEIGPARFVATRGKVSYKDEEMGEFKFSLKLYEDSNITKLVSTEREITTTDMVYADLRMTEIGSAVLKMGIQDCFASPSENRENAINTYPIIEDKCFTDDTVVKVMSSDTRYEFGFMAFQFTGDIKQIYLHCKAAVCKANDKTGACDQPSKKCEGKKLKRSLSNTTTAEIFGKSHLVHKRSVYEAAATQGVIAQDRMARSIPITSDAIMLEQPESSFSIKEAFGKTSWPIALMCMVGLALNITLVVALVVRKIRKRIPAP
ncbi:unnamed protein product [Owenia fusiformis]|uniref:ZP domain-containing protein n=1 Tax=Owenia fusiformis TaxID=6347 RepID=A0A8S4PV37_OWEFU|nr:unnamed protein product [Owenia fusiformis]